MVVRRRRARRVAASVAATLALLLAGCGRPAATVPAGDGDAAAAGSAAGSPLPHAGPAQVAAGCAAQMVAATCRVQNGPAPAGEGVVFVAGLGAVDGKVYSALRASGDAMCEVVRSRCDQAWDGAACRLARGLYLAAPARPPAGAARRDMIPGSQGGIAGK